MIQFHWLMCIPRERNLPLWKGANEFRYPHALLCISNGMPAHSDNWILNRNMNRFVKLLMSRRIDASNSENQWESIRFYSKFQLGMQTYAQFCIGKFDSGCFFSFLPVCQLKFNQLLMILNSIHSAETNY